MTKLRFMIKCVVAVAALSAVIANSGMSGAIEERAPVAAEICGECDSHELAHSTVHDFSACEFALLHEGECGCGGSECHLQIADDYCQDCSHGDCKPETLPLPVAENSPVAGLLRAETAGTSTCFNRDAIVDLVAREDAETIRELVEVAGGSVRINSARQALQVLGGCAAQVALHVPLSGELLQNFVLADS